jgi:hypothetical protein
MNYNSKNQFEQLAIKSYFRRVDETHPLNLWLGVDSDGHKALRFLGEFSPVTLSGTKSIGVKQFLVQGSKCIQFSLIDPESSELFYKFCDDIIDSSRQEANQQGGYHFVTHRFARWKKMFITKSDILPEESIMGLIGELYFLLSYMIPTYGQHKAVEAWSAPDPTIKDFSIDKTWFEIKTVGAKSSVVKISSLQQLESKDPGNLVIFRLEKMSPSFYGTNLNEIVVKINKVLESPEDCDLFQTKLLLAKYTYNEKYDEYVYDIKASTVYSVDQNFPALRSEGLQTAVQNVQYELLIDQLEKYIKIKGK